MQVKRNAVLSMNAYATARRKLANTNPGSHQGKSKSFFFPRLVFDTLKYITYLCVMKKEKEVEFIDYANSYNRSSI